MYFNQTIHMEVHAQYVAVSSIVHSIDFFS